jgi:Ca2+/H+ antiporter, TMEM165/GDT1 family
MLSGPFEALAVAFGVVFLAELGDKTQLLVLGLATRYRALPVIVGVVLASGLVMGLSVLVGATLGSLFDVTLLQLVGGAIFLAFAAWTVLGREEDDDDIEAMAAARPNTRTALRAAAIVTGTFVLAELGDKSMLATLTLATQAEPMATWFGATLALVGVSLIAIAVGRQLGTRIPGRLLRYVSAAAFAIFGLLLIGDALV